jgi:hypothetical protein
VTLGAVGGDKRGSERGGGGSSEQSEALHCVSVTGEGGGCPVGRGIGNERSEAPRPAGKHADLNAMTRAWKARTARSHDGDGPNVSSQMGFALRKLRIILGGEKRCETKMIKTKPSFNMTPDR